MKLLIVEDEAPAFRRLQKILDELPQYIEILEVIDSVEWAVRWLTENSSPDLILMDIQLSDGISFEIFEEITIDSPVIFTTAFDDYMLRAFKVNSIDYLLKPIKKDDLEKSLQKYSNLRNLYGKQEIDLNSLIKNIKLDDRKYKTRFLLKQGGRMISFQVGDIACFTTKDGLAYLHGLDGKKHLIDYTLDELVQELDPDQFYRINRQCLVNISAINTVHKYFKGKLLVELCVETDEPETVSAEKATHFKAWLGDK